MTIVSPLAEGLLAVAAQLGEVRSERRSVEQAALRRAISSAYYAVFHALCFTLCQGTGFASEIGEEGELLYRHLEHSKARDTLTSRRARLLHDDIPRIGDAFVELRRLREDAEYSPPGRIGGEQKLLTRNEAKTLIALAETTVRLLDALSDDVRRKLAILLLVRPNRR